MLRSLLLGELFVENHCSFFPPSSLKKEHFSISSPVSYVEFERRLFYATQLSSMELSTTLYMEQLLINILCSLLLGELFIERNPRASFHPKEKHFYQS